MSSSLEHLVNSPRFLAVCLPHWPAERARRAGRPLSGGRGGAKPDGLRSLDAPVAPLAVTRFEKNARRIGGVDARAAALELAPGMMLTNARALVPDLTFCDEEPDADAAALAALALWCRRYAPHTAPHSGPNVPDAVGIDITGAAHLFGGERAVLGDILRRLAGLGYTVRGAIADTGPGARALAQAHNRFISAAGALHEDLNPLPVAVLGLGEAATGSLQILGLRRIGDLARVPRATLRPRLGADAMARLDEALGAKGAPLSPLKEIIPARAFRRFFDPLERPEDILACLAGKDGRGGLADAVAETLGNRDEGARALALSLYRVDGVVKTIDIATSAPMRQASRMTALFADRFARLEGGLEPGYGFDLIALEATATGPLAPRQALAPGVVADGGDIHALAPLIDRLSGRLGASAVRRMAPAQSHLPERAVTLTPVVATGNTSPPNWQDAPWGLPWGEQSETPLARPLQLLPSPEPIEAVAEVPDAAPVRFVWRRIAHVVVRADGPERIAAEWWREAAPSRDYYRLEDESGQRFWVYRLGLYGRETTQPRWYMHGLLP